MGTQTKRFNAALIAHIMGLLLALNGLFIFIAFPVGLYYGEPAAFSFLYSSLICLVLGTAAFLITRGRYSKEFRKREGFLIVTLGWLMMTFFGTLPYVLSGSIPSFTNAFFETMSGYTTTGATILNDIEALPKCILLWRSLTQWIGGMGIIVLAVAILPILGIGGMQLFVAEAPGISPDKLHPRITETAKRLWSIYLGLTLIAAMLYWAGGMSLFDAVNHSFTTLATGGYSPPPSSLVALRPFLPSLDEELKHGRNESFHSIHRYCVHVCRRDQFHPYLWHNPWKISTADQK